MRGKDVLVRPDLIVRGITPAYVGKRVRHDTRTSRCKDHPRVCGEKATGQSAGSGFLGLPPLCGEKLHVSNSCLFSSGSPPRMRGKDPIPAAQPPLTGITPAYAGKSVRRR